MAEWWHKVNTTLTNALKKFTENGPNRYIDEEYNQALENYPQIRHVVRTYRDEHIQRIPEMGQKVWDELGDGDQLALEFALEFCIEYMVENTMRAARAGHNAPPPQPGALPKGPDTPSAGPTGGRFKTYRLRIR